MHVFFYWYMRRQRSLVKLLTGSQFWYFCMQDGDDANGSSQSQLVADCPPGEASASEASASDAYSMFALSLDNDSCRSPEVLGATPPATERPKRNLYMPEQRPLVHFQVLSHAALMSAFSIPQTLIYSTTKANRVQ